MKRKVPKTRLDYVELYAERLKSDPSIFEQQRMLIESQLESSRQVFRSMLGDGDDFEQRAREYLRKIGMI
ncbi:MAG: hypothetical protein HY365_02520 [Candidatus Aenigmarchaeota archaeon]|nr:hypothetical protein [Candidatus Aenigmarchaeota archaeon]